MTFDEKLNQVADRYRSQGFEVHLHPGRELLPPFAADFKVEILATSDKINVLAVVKPSPSVMEAVPKLAENSEITSQQEGWRMDLFVLGPDQVPGQEIREVKESTVEEIHHSIQEVERMNQAGFTTPSVPAAWACLESAMRRHVRLEGHRNGQGTSPRTLLNELFSHGVFSNQEFRELEAQFHLRNQIVHGFSVPSIPANSVSLLLATARRLLQESTPTKMTA